MLFDNHIHITRLPEAKKVIKEFNRRNIGFNAIACDPDEWDFSFHLFSEYNSCSTNRILFGIHPMVAYKASEENFNKLNQILETKNSSLGEIGLDKRFPGYEPNGMQEKVFIRQVEIALKKKLDFQIHCVGDYQRILLLLKELGFGKNVANVSKPIFHRFGGDSNIVIKALEMGCLFSLHLNSFQKKSTLDSLHLIPKSSLLFESDADETFAKKTENFIDISNRIELILGNLRKNAENF